MSQTLTAREDPALVLRIERRSALHYADGPSDAEDRPAFVRAASGLAWFGDSIAIVQDDASFIGMRAKDGTVTAIALPRGEGGRRRFEDRLGNRLSKLDLESCVTVRTPEGERLVAFGSGSLPVRETIAVVRMDAKAAPVVVDAGALYTKIRAALGLGTVLANLEGAAIVHGALRLFHRGVPAGSVDVDLLELVAWLDRNGAPPVPEPRGFRGYELGAERGVPFGFTEAATLADGRIVFLAAAEDTDDPVLDGAVLGSRFGVIEDGGLRFGPILDERGDRFAEKAEGLAPDPSDPRRFLIVADADDPDRPAELLEAIVEGL
ncbi:MAG: hypothetical protein HOV80_01825 [Polyangiaceae bacterium]|nr:hypothetical protein [Polyangiaceae bacterium]